MSLGDKSTITPADDMYVYLISDDGLANGKAELNKITRIPETSRTVSLNNSMTATEIQDEIDAVGSYIPDGATITFQFADGTYNLDSALSFQGFYGGGQIYIQGNTGETSGLHTNQSVHLNFNNSSNGIYAVNNSGISLVYIRFLRVTVQNGYSGILAQREGHFRIYYNYVTCGNTTNGANTALYALQGSRVIFSNNYVSNCFYGIRAHQNSIVDSTNNDDTGTQPRYGLGATRTSVVGKNGTQPAGGIANETSSTGSDIR